MSFYKVQKTKKGQSLRSLDYRKHYFEGHNGYFEIYCCSYCGRLLFKKDATVDHIVPVHAAERMRLVRWLYRREEGGINSAKNLTTACSRCNSAKGSKCGIWLLRGWMGRLIYPVLWFAFMATWPTFLSYAIAFFTVAAEQFR